MGWQIRTECVKARRCDTVRGEVWLGFRVAVGVWGNMRAEKGRVKAGSASEPRSRVWRMKEVAFPVLLLLGREVSWKVKAVIWERSHRGKAFLAILRLEGSLMMTLASPSKW